MGEKYRITAFDYPYKGYDEYVKQTRYLIVALWYMIFWSIKHFGVNLFKRG